jgi:RNA 3'-terminal phosphate cyclase (ATP)
MLVIDGSAGEGGGQVLRTALGLSLVTQTPFRIEKIRGRRPKPGLQRQHLACVKAAALIGDAGVEGDALSSQELTFHPRALRPGNYELAIGSAGSTTLLLQAVLPALLRASGPTTLALEGGTHNRLAPTFEFLAQSFVPVLAQLGARIDVKLVRYGFEPAGGGRIEVSVTPAPLKPIELLERGALIRRTATAVIASIPQKVAARELAMVVEDLDFAATELHTEHVTASSPGNAIIVALTYQHVADVFVGLGERGITAEKVAHRTTGEVKRSLRTDAPVGSHLADQLMIPFALAGGGAFRTVELTQHSHTQLELIPRFLDVKLECQPEGNGTWRFGVIAPK